MIISIILVIICLLILSIVYKPSKIDTSFKLQIQPKTIIIIGTGLSAMIVALTIADLGHRAIIIDQTIDVHGSTSSYIGINCADTTIQKTYNISDHYSIFIKDEKVQDPLTQYLFKNSKNSIDWLSKKGIEFSDIYKLNKHSKARTHIFKNYKLTYILLNYIRTENEKISMIKNTSATSFIVDKNGKVDGIICEDGRLIFSNSIVITNDYNSLDLCKSIGGNITNLDKYTYNPINFIDSNGQLIYGYSDLLKTGIILNKYGKRFCNEHSNNKAIIKAMNRQISSNIFYLILPNENTLVKMFKSVLHPMTITDMSNFMNIDKKVLVNEFKQYNMNSLYFIDDYGKTLFLDTPFDIEAAFYVGIIMPKISTLGGVKVDTEARILDINNKPIPNMFAAGTIIDRSNNNDLLYDMILGHIAGVKAINYGTIDDIQLQKNQ